MSVFMRWALCEVKKAHNKEHSVLQAMRTTMQFPTNAFYTQSSREKLLMRPHGSKYMSGPYLHENFSTYVLNVYISLCMVFLILLLTRCVVFEFISFKLKML